MELRATTNNNWKDVTIAEVKVLLVYYMWIQSKCLISKIIRKVTQHSKWSLSSYISRIFLHIYCTFISQESKTGASMHNEQLVKTLVGPLQTYLTILVALFQEETLNKSAILWTG
jgi:hypothetical protein